MELKLDCVRDVLLAVEAYPLRERIFLDDICKKLSDYSYDDVWYTCLKLDEAGYLNVTKASTLSSSVPMIVEINDMTFSGHEFLNSIRKTDLWDKVKSIGKAAGVSSVKLLGEAAQEVAKAALLSALQAHL